MWYWVEILGVLATCIHLLGLLSAAHAALYGRTSQGSVAWAVSLVTFPYVALPLYWLIGRNRFHGYVAARRRGAGEISHIADELRARMAASRRALPEKRHDLTVMERLASLPFTGHNDCALLINGRETFDAIFSAIESAKSYVIVQYFIVREDALGMELHKRLCARAREGLRVYFLYDEIGSVHLPHWYLDTLRHAGVEVSAFKTTQGGRVNRFQLNFRNHRKIVVIDGETAFVGGLNVGDEYMDRHRTLTPWRDTHARLRGPAVQSLQLTFLEDWHWATGTVPALDWMPRHSERGDDIALVIPTGPADELETCGLFFTQVIDAARERVWIASPYFVPDERVIGALQLAALRGVDVRVLLPQNPDHYFPYLAACAYLTESMSAGVKFLRYQPGFMHSKVILVDDDMAAVGSANLDNRSIRLNFEVTLLTVDKDFAARVASMFETDFEKAVLVPAADFESRPIWFRAVARLARLCSPLL